MLSHGWLMRALLGLGGAVTLLLCLPVARGALEAQRADTALRALGENRPVPPQAIRDGMQALNRSVDADDSATRLFKRSALFAAAALSPVLKTPEPQRSEWLRQARADVRQGLSRDPARSSEWLSLALVSEALDGPSREIVPLVLMSIQTGRMLGDQWPATTRLILNNWGYFSDEEKARLTDYVAMAWRLEPDRRWFGRMVYDVFDEVILRSMLRSEPMKTQEELTKYIKDARK